MRSVVVRFPARSWLLIAVGVIMVASIVLACFVAVPGVARADNGSVSSDAQKVAVFEDVAIAFGEVWSNVVVVGGDVVVDGTVEGVLVVVGGDLTVGHQAVVGGRGSVDDAAVVSVFGDIRVAEGGQVLGRTVDVAGSIGDAARSAVVDPVVRTWSVGSILNWVWSTVLLLVAGVIAAAVAPRQLAVVADRVRHHFFSSLGWGALGAIIVAPLVTIILIVTIIGIIIAVPWAAVGLPLLALFGMAAVGAMIGRLILGARSEGRDTLIAATVLGLVIVSVLRWIPVGGAIILFLLGLVGFGATSWPSGCGLRDRRARRRQSAMGSAEQGVPPIADGLQPADIGERLISGAH